MMILSKLTCELDRLGEREIGELAVPQPAEHHHEAGGIAVPHEDPVLRPVTVLHLVRLEY